MIEILLSGIVGIGIFMFVAGLVDPKTDTTHQRLAVFEGETVNLQIIELQRPLSDRVLRPIANRIRDLLSKRTPTHQQQELQKRIFLAGLGSKVKPADFIALKISAALGLGLVLFVLGITIAKPALGALGLIAGGVLGYIYPDLWLRQKIAKRKREILLALPNSIDLLTTAVEAGLSFDAAVARVVEKYNNAFSSELEQFLIEVKLGKSRLEALDDMAKRIGIEEVQNFTQAVIQSQQMGVSLGRVLRIQADEIRTKRKQRAEEKAARASLKMLFPMIGCIFPTLWLVLLGPAVLIVMKTFIK